MRHGTPVFTARAGRFAGRRLVPPLALAAVFALLVPSSSREEESGPVAHVSLAGGAELGLGASERATVAEVAAAAGWEIGTIALRPELEFALGLEPDMYFVLRPGASWSLPGYPFRLRAAVDAANARRSRFGWRWFVVGASAELRLTGQLGFDAGLDVGAPLSRGAGLPLLLRVGTSIRF